MPESSYMLTPGTTNEDQALKRKIALALMQQGMDTSPVQHWTQGAARALQGALGGYEMYRTEKADKEERAKGNELLAQVLAGGTAPTTPASAPPVSAPADYTPTINAAAQQHGLDPKILTALLKQESGFNPNAVSPKGAQGIAQFMPATAQEMGVNPLDPNSAIPGAAKYLAQNRDKFGGDMVKALAAYNWGPGNVAKWDGDISKLPPETQKYVQAIMPNAQRPQQPNTSAITQMLGNRYTAPIAQQIAGGMIQQQFKPSEYDFKERPDGSIVAINKKNPQDMRVVNPGDSQSLIDFAAQKESATTKAKLEAEKAATAPERQKQERQVADIVTTDIDRAIKTIDTATLPTTGAVGGLLSNVGGTAARDLRGLIDTVKANAGFQELNKMRQSSPTGGALGNVTEKEIAFLQATIGNLEQSQTEAQLKDNLRRVKNTYLDIIHGPGKGPEREKLTYQNEGGWKDMGNGVRIREKR